MSRTSKNKRSYVTKELIRTRLIEISLKVENLVYYKEPITMEEAENYIQEVNSYKAECFRDERSMQVIDKLNRCMKTIIAEHKEFKLDHVKLRDSNINLDSNGRTVSPVYSLPDEDRTQLSQFQAHVSERLSSNINGKQFGNNVHDKAQTSTDIVGHGVNASELYKDIETIQCHDTDIPIHKSLSNINDIDNENIYMDMESSQSILNHIDILQYFPSPRVQAQDANIPGNLPITNDVETVQLGISESNRLENFPETEKLLFTQPNFQRSQKRINDSKIKEKLKVNKIAHVNLPCSLSNFPEIVKPIATKSAESNQKVLRDSKIKDKLEVTKVIHIDLPGSLNDNNNIALEYGAIEKSLNIHYNKLENKKSIPFNRANSLITVSKNKYSIVNETEQINKKHIPKDHAITIISKSNNDNAENLSQHYEESLETILSENNVHSMYTTNRLNFTQKTNTPINNLAKSDAYIKTLDSCDQNIVTSKNIKNCKIKRTKKQTESKINTCNYIGTAKKKRVPRQKKVTNKCDGIKSKENGKHDTNKTTDNKPKLRYSRKPKDQTIVIQKINDLSWLKNIRFIREIKENEYDHNISIAETFWDNYNLPPNIDQNDFL